MSLSLTEAATLNDWNVHSVAKPDETSMSVLFIVGPNVRWPRRMPPTSDSYWVCAARSIYVLTDAVKRGRGRTRPNAGGAV